MLLVHESEIADGEKVWGPEGVLQNLFILFSPLPVCIMFKHFSYRLVGSFSLVLQQVIKDGTLKINEALVNENNKIIDVSKLKMMEVEIKYKTSIMNSHH